VNLEIGHFQKIHQKLPVIGVVLHYQHTRHGPHRSVHPVGV
jgi:hypothetical protein